MSARVSLLVVGILLAAEVAQARVAPPTPLVEVTGAKVEARGAGLAADEVEAVGRLNAPHVLACYEELLERHPRAAGTLVTTVTVDAEGSVTGATLDNGVAKDRTFELCVTSATKAWFYPKASGAAPVAASTTFRLRPRSDTRLGARD